MAIAFGNTASVISPSSYPVGGRGDSFSTPGAPASPAVQTAKAGFGENTLSISSAALQAISHTIEGAKDLVVNRAELQAQREEQQAKEEAAKALREEFRSDQSVEDAAPAEAAVFQRPEAAPQARSFSGIEEDAPSAGFDVASTPQDQGLAAAGAPQGLLTINTLNLLI